jgi:hypothetical protein
VLGRPLGPLPHQSGAHHQMFGDSGFTNASAVRSRGERALALTLGIVLLLAIAHAAYVLCIGLWKPLLDLHSFRQTQTALSVYWLAQGGPLIAYETPVLGAPWSIPFEFPLYQWIVALLAMTDVPLDVAGRLVSFAFYMATLWPLWKLMRLTGLGRVAFINTAILFVTAPLYLYWSRTFLMESCALFFCCLALALLAGYLSSRSVPLAFAAMAAGTAGALVKSTTFPAFVVVGGCLALLDVGARLRRRPAWLQLGCILVPALILAVPLIINLAWVVYSDHLKNANEFGRLLTSAQLTGWTLGPIEQRLLPLLWDATILKRVLPDLFGRHALLLGFVAVGAALARPRFGIAAGLAVIGFVVPFVVFTNLHVVHNYYQYSNGIFALAAVGIGAASIAEQRAAAHSVLAATIVLLLGASQIAGFYNGFVPQIEQDRSQSDLLKAAMFVRKATPATASVLIFGDDWDSTIPYYSERKSLAVPGWAPPALIDRVIADPQSFLGDRPLAAIVLCRDHLALYKDRADAVVSFAQARPLLGEFGGCQVFSAAR